MTKFVAYCFPLMEKKMKSDSPFYPPLTRAVQHALEHLDQLDTMPVAGLATKEELRARLLKPLTDEGVDPVQIIDELVRDTKGGLHGTPTGRFFGWVIGGALPSAVAGDWLASTWDQNNGMFSVAPATGVIEEVCGIWLKEIFGLPQKHSFALLTGCQMAHFTCLAAARHHVLKVQGWDDQTQGLFGAPKIHVLTGEHRHGTTDRAFRMLGIGTDSIVKLPIDNFTLQPDVLERALKEYNGKPIIVVLQAGEINTGTYDKFTELVPLAHKYNAWVHVDGAFGLWAKATPKYAHLMDGCELADSWSTDGHKWLNVPFDSAFAFVAHPDSHRAAFAVHASYLTHAAGDERDAVDWNPEWSRRARCVATYAALRELGKNGIADLIERTCHHAKQIARRIGELDGAEMMWEPIINQGLVRFLDQRPNATQDDHSKQTDAVIAEILKSGEAFFTGTTWRDMRCMRISVCNWRTNDSDVNRVVRATKAAIEKLR